MIFFKNWTYLICPKVDPNLTSGTCQNVVYHVSGQFTKLKFYFQLGV